MPIAPRPMTATKLYYSATELCRLLDISVYCLDMWVRLGNFPPPVRPGGPRGKRLWPAEQINRYLNELNKTAIVGGA
jgi:predicted site-specific integrase-resolvase